MKIKAKRHKREEKNDARSVGERDFDNRQYLSFENSFE